MKIRFIPKRKLRVATARRMPRTGMEDFAQEPNMSFGRAIVVVVVLHLVAVAGICAFSKTRNIAQQNPLPHPAKEAAADPADTGGASASTTGQPGAQTIQNPVKAPVGPGVTDVKQTAGANPAVQPGKSQAGETAPSVKDSGTFYTVASGDTPMSIAKKLHVSYNDLLKLNKITDPKKLRVGQKLRVPVKKKTASPT